MSDITPTPAQRVALEAIADGRVERYYPARLGYRPSAPPRWVSVGLYSLKSRQDVIDRCVQNQWAHVVGDGGRTRRPVVLTDAGREALACHS
jgi:hypothetical protein